MVNLFKKYGFVIFIGNFLVICAIRNVLASSQINVSRTTNEQSAKSSPNTKKKVTFNLNIEEIKGNKNKIKR